jgi:hypothetical protein
MESHVVRKNKKQLRLTAQNALKGEALHREYMPEARKTCTFAQFGNIVFSKGLAQLKKELLHGEQHG